MKRVGRIAFAFLLAVTVVAGCSDDDDGAGGGAGDGGGDNTLTISERDYGFDVAGEVEAGTVTIEVVNTGTELHEIAMTRLQDGKTIDDVRAALEAASEDDEDALEGIGTPDSTIEDLAGVQLPGTSYAITGSGIDAGEYAVMCFIPNPQGEPHFSLGMIAGFTIGGGNADEPPDADVTYTADDEALEGPESLDAGETTIEVVNDSSVGREIVLAKLKDGKTFDDVPKWLDAAGRAQPDVATTPLDFFTFTFDADQDRLITVDLTPGRWGIATTAAEEDFGGRFEGVPHAVTFTVD